MFRVGQEVIFGRPNGEQTRGVVVKVNRKSLKIRQTEERGSQRIRSEGTIWLVHPSLVRAADETSIPSDEMYALSVRTDDRQRAEFRVGQRVSWIGRDGVPRTGTVRRVNVKSVSVDEDGRQDGRYWRISPCALAAV